MTLKRTMRGGRIETCQLTRSEINGAAFKRALRLFEGDATDADLAYRAKILSRIEAAMTGRSALR
jgi:hypothetical protein